MEWKVGGERDLEMNNLLPLSKQAPLSVLV